MGRIPRLSGFGSFNEAQCDNPPLDPSMNEGMGPTPSEAAGHASQTVANVGSAHGWGLAKAMAVVPVASAKGSYGKAPAALAGYAVGAYFGASSDCGCP